MNKISSVESLINLEHFSDYVYGYPSKRMYKPFSENFIDYVSEIKDTINLYIHIPFCIKKCYFCNLYSTDNFVLDDISEYVKMLIRQMQVYSNFFGKMTIETIYFGGGTPSLLNENELDEIYKGIHKYFNVTNTCTEQTLEGCPVTLSHSVEKLKFLNGLGINRISIGVQSFHTEELIRFGRSHTVEQSVQAIENIQKAGIEKYNIDLIYGIEEQTSIDWLYSLDKLMSFNPTSATLYPLNIRPNTSLYKGQEGCIDTERMFDLYDLTVDYMKEHTYRQETFVLFTHENEQNGYKQQENEFLGKPLIGIGAAARSYIGNIHYSSEDSSKCSADSVRRFIQKVNSDPFVAEYAYILSLDEQMRRNVILGLLSFENGVKTSRFYEKFNVDIREQFKNEFLLLERYEMIYESDGAIRLTKYGRKMSNILIKLFT